MTTKGKRERAVYFVNGVDYDWHNDARFNETCKNFSQSKAAEPKTEMTEAKKVHTLYTNTFQQHLQKGELCSRLEYTGSAYEGVKVDAKANGSSDLEFDVMVIMKGGHQLQVS